jgi:hypothetical protein
VEAIQPMKTRREEAPVDVDGNIAKTNEQLKPILEKIAGSAPEITGHLSGYVRIQAESLSHAKTLVQGNAVFEAGGSVEIRELPRG